MINERTKQLVIDYLFDYSSSYIIDDTTQEIIKLVFSIEKYEGIKMWKFWVDRLLSTHELKGLRTYIERDKEYKANKRRQ